MIFILIW